MARSEYQHGATDEVSVQAWLSHSLRPSSYDFPYDYDAEGNEIMSYTERESVERNFDASNCVYIADNAERYATYALITIKVDDTQVLQVADNDYLMLCDADYEIVDISYSVSGTHHRQKDGTR